MGDPLIMYIDQNHWDKLEKVYYKKLKDDLVQDVLDKLNELKSSNKIRIVLDLQRTTETAQRKYEDSRKDLFNLMLSLSEEFFVIPWVYLQDLEIENFFLRKIGKSENNIREMSIGKGFSYMIGETPEVQSDSLNSEELTIINEKLREYYPELLKIEFERYKKKDDKFQLEHVQKSEEARKILFQMDSDEERKQYLIEHDFIRLIGKIREFLNTIEEKRVTIYEDVRNLLLAKKVTLKAPQFQHYLEGLLARYPEPKKLIIVLDNARAHHSKVLKPFLEDNKNRLELVFLPPYSPDLNPMEWFWKFLRKMVTHNTFFGTFKEFQRALIKFIVKHKTSSPEIKTRCSYAKLFSSS